MKRTTLQLQAGYWFASRTRRRTYHVAERSYGEAVALCGQRFVVWDASPGRCLLDGAGATVCLPCEVLARSRKLAERVAIAEATA